MPDNKGVGGGRFDVDSLGGEATNPGVVDCSGAVRYLSSSGYIIGSFGAGVLSRVLAKISVYASWDRREESILGLFSAGSCDHFEGDDDPARSKDVLLFTTC